MEATICSKKINNKNRFVKQIHVWWQRQWTKEWKNRLITTPCASDKENYILLSLRIKNNLIFLIDAYSMCLIKNGEEIFYRIILGGE